MKYSLLLLLLSNACAELPILKVLLAVREHYQSGCVYLLTDKNHEFYESLRLRYTRHRLTESSITHSASEIQTFNISQVVAKCRGNRPLFVISSGRNSTKLYLQKFSELKDFSSPRWLLILEDVVKEENVLSAVNIPFDCEFLVAKCAPNGTVKLVEVYRVNQSLPLQSLTVGEWSQADVIHWQTSGLYTRRRDLHGLKFIAGVVDDPPMIAVKEDNYKVTHTSGFFPELWRQLEKDLNFTSEYVIPRDHAFGSKKPDGWNGMIGMILKKEIHVSVCPFMMTSSRAEVIAYSVPWASTRACVFIRTPLSSDAKLEVFLQPFSPPVWIALITTMLMLAFFLTSLHWVGRRCTKLDALYSRSYGPKNCVHYIWGSFCSQGHNETPNAGSCRILFLFSYLTAVVCLTGYSCDFIAHLTIRERPLPFTTMEGILKDKSYRFGVISKSGLYNNFESTHDPVMRAVFENLLLPESAGNKLPLTDKEAVRLICSHRYAFMGNYDITMELKTCPMSVLPHASFPMFNAMVFEKGSPYRGLINHSLQGLRRVGILKRLYDRLWAVNTPEPAPMERVGFDEFLPLLGLLIVGLLTAIITFSMELVFRWRISRRPSVTMRRQHQILQSVRRSFSTPAVREKVELHDTGYPLNSGAS